MLETLVMVAFFTWVPVLVAVGMFFPFWYSARQMARGRRVVRARTRTAT